MKNVGFHFGYSEVEAILRLSGMTINPMRFKPKRLAGYSEAEILQEIKRVILEECGGVVPTQREFGRVARLNPNTVVNKFGSYGEAVKQAGFTYADKYSLAQVESNLREVLLRADGYHFTYEFYRQNGGVYSSKTIKSIFHSSWKDALAAIGAKKRPRIVHVAVSANSQRRKAIASLADSDLYKELDRIWQLNGQRPTYTEFRRLSSIGPSIYQTRFGSWIKAVEAFCRARGVNVQGKGGTTVTKEILLDELRMVSAKAPKVSLTYQVYKANGGTYSRKPFKSHFGSWTKAVNAAGGVSGRQQKYSKDELFDEIQNLWEQFGRQPTFSEMDEKGKYSAVCYAARFGSWSKAVHAFCADRDSDSALTPPPILESPSVPQGPSEPDQNKVPMVIPSSASAPQIVVHNTGRSVPKRLRWRVFARDNFKCKGCGRSPATHGVVLEADHVIAWTNGGETVFENLQTLCEACNNGKSNF